MSSPQRCQSDGSHTVGQRASLPSDRCPSSPSCVSDLSLFSSSFLSLPTQKELLFTLPSFPSPFPCLCFAVILSFPVPFFLLFSPVSSARFLSPFHFPFLPFTFSPVVLSLSLSGCLPLSLLMGWTRCRLDVQQHAPASPAPPQPSIVFRLMPRPPAPPETYVSPVGTGT